MTKNNLRYPRLQTILNISNLVNSYIVFFNAFNIKSIVIFLNCFFLFFTDLVTDQFLTDTISYNFLNGYLEIYINYCE